jgi:hypothetical protein
MFRTHRSVNELVNYFLTSGFWIRDGKVQDYELNDSKNFSDNKMHSTGRDNKALTYTFVN